MFDLHGRVALVTGGNGGIGLGLAEGLGRAGAAVVIAGRDAEKSERACQALRETNIRCWSVQADVSEESQVATMISACVELASGLDILVNNAGTNVSRKAQDCSLADWNAVLNANLTSTFLCARQAYPWLRRSGRGKIINIGSMTALFGTPTSPAYSASKGGIVALTRSLATDWASENIQVNAILPGWIETDLTQRLKDRQPALDQRVTARTPAHRWGRPGDLAGAAVFFASSASDFVTGTHLAVDGGFSVMN